MQTRERSLLVFSSQDSYVNFSDGGGTKVISAGKQRVAELKRGPIQRYSVRLARGCLLHRLCHGEKNELEQRNKIR